MALIRVNKWKMYPNNPTRRDQLVHEYCPPSKVDEEIERLLATYQVRHSGSPSRRTQTLRDPLFCPMNLFYLGVSSNRGVSWCIGRLVASSFRADPSFPGRPWEGIHEHPSTFTYLCFITKRTVMDVLLGPSHHCLCWLLGYLHSWCSTLIVANT